MTQVTLHDDIAEIRITQERVDAAAAPDLKIDLEQAMTTAPRRVVLDLSDVRFMDSTGLGLFVSLLKMLGPNGAIAVAGAQPPVVRLFELTRLDTLFRLVGDVAAARALVRD